MSDHSNDWVGQTLSGGRYRVDAKLGEGGMGDVYKASDRNLDTDVVVKAPRKAMLDDPEFARRFAVEIRSMVKLSHPNILKVIDVGDHEGVPFAVMQYLSGGTLNERLELGKDGRPLPVPPASVSSWLPGIAAALDFIHGKGYIHRDVKPANILFDTHGHAYLSDFGIAKVLADVEAVSKNGSAAMPVSGIVLGTPEYMAPELIMGDSFDGKVDQYALATTVYEVLCGRKPFTGETSTAILVRQSTIEPPSMTELPPGTSPAVTKVVLKGLAKKPEGRYATCVEFANALVAALAKAEVARPPVVRLACPACGVSFAAPADLTKIQGRKSKCQACGAPFRIAQDGLSLIKIDPNLQPTPSGSVEVIPSVRQPSLDSRPNPTLKFEAEPDPYQLDPESLPASRPRKGAAVPAPVSQPVDSSEDFDHDSHNPSLMPWIIGGVGVAVVALLGIIFLATRSSSVPTEQLALVDPKPPVPAKPLIIKRPPTPVVTPQPKPAVKPIETVVETPAPTDPAAADPATAPPTDPATAPATDPAMTPATDAAAVPPTEAEMEEKPGADVPDPEVPVDPAANENAPPGLRLKLTKGKERLSLREIMTKPDEYLDQLVSPTERLIISTDVARPRDPAGNLTVKCKEGPYQALETPGTPFHIVLKPELLDQLRSQVGSRAIEVGDYPAMIQMKVIKNPGNPNGYLGVIEWMEFLYYIDPRPISNGLSVYKDVYGVIHLSLNGAAKGHSPNYKQWQDRFQIQTSNIKIKYKKENYPPVYGEWGKWAANPNGHAAFFHKWLVQHLLHF